MAFDKNYIYTLDEDRETIYDEDEAYRVAEQVGGEVKLCYYVDRFVEYPTTTDGEFLGFLVKTEDGELICSVEDLE